MNDAKREAIHQAAGRLVFARMKVDGLAMSNTYGLTADEKLHQERAYQLARAEFNEAQAEVDRVTNASFNPEE